MQHARPSLTRLLSVYVVVCAAVLGATWLGRVPPFDEYVHLLVAAIFLLSALRLTRADPRHYGVALGGLLEPSDDDRPRGPFGLFDLGRALFEATPSALRELGVAIAIAAVVFPLYAAGYAWWWEPSTGFTLRLPPNLVELAIAQVVVVALPEEAFFRGYVQTTLDDLSKSRTKVPGARVALSAWLLQAALFALIHFLVSPHPSRLAVFFPALLFGWVRGWRGGIGAAIALHAMSNLYSEILSRSWL